MSQIGECLTPSLSKRGCMPRGEMEDVSGGGAVRATFLSRMGTQICLATFGSILWTISTACFVALCIISAHQAYWCKILVVLYGFCGLAIVCTFVYAAIMGLRKFLRYLRHNRNRMDLFELSLPGVHGVSSHVDQHCLPQCHNLY